MSLTKKTPAQMARGARRYAAAAMLENRARLPPRRLQRARSNAPLMRMAMAQRYCCYAADVAIR